MNRSTPLALLLACLAGLAGALAVPSRSGGSGASNAEAAVFAALLKDAARGGPAGSPKRQELLRQMRAGGPAALARFLAQAVKEDGAESRRAIALECLGACATAPELVVLVGLASPAKGPSSPALRDALRNAVVQTLARDPRAFAELSAGWRRAGPELGPELIAAVAERGDPAGLEFLARIATFESGRHDRALAQACLRLAPEARSDEARAFLEELCVLLDSEDRLCVQTASIALARARIEAAIPLWIELLASESHGLRERARLALEQVTGLALGADGERWRAWYASESDWFENESDQALADLAAEDDARVLAAVRALSARRLQRERLAEAIEALLVHVNPAVRLHACAALAGLGSTSVVPALADTLADEDQTVAEGAWKALRTLTGLQLPLDPELWSEELARPAS